VAAGCFPNRFPGNFVWPSLSKAFHFCFNEAFDVPKGSGPLCRLWMTGGDMLGEFQVYLKRGRENGLMWNWWGRALLVG